MKFDKNNDYGEDIRINDIVYIKFKVLEKFQSGDVKLQYLPRRGKDEYAARRINAIFIKRPKSKILKWLVNKLAV